MDLQQKKIDKLIGHLETLIRSLNHCNDLGIHRAIDQFYYIQKVEELKILLAQIEETRFRLRSIRERANSHYVEISDRWRRDVQLMNQYVKDSEQNHSIPLRIAIGPLAIGR